VPSDTQFRPTAAATDRLHRFVALLLKWNAKLNLISSRDENTIWERHVADSLQLAELIPAGSDRAVDLGTGGGFPGLVLAIATGMAFDLVEADQRKAAFLRTAIIETGASATVHARRIEAVTLAPAGLVTARALAPLSRLLPLASRVLADGGTCLFLKGAQADAEIAAASANWEMSVSRTPSRTGADGVILGISNLRRRAV
jgi:16S rRNA (guanine527-N7)-methyltransferase